MKRAVDGRRRVGRDLPAAKSSRELFSAPLKGRVLVVDDAAPMCEILSLFLTYKGLEVKTANSPAEALSHASQTQFDLIILDWDLATP